MQKNVITNQLLIFQVQMVDVEQEPEPEPEPVNQLKTRRQEQVSVINLFCKTDSCVI